MRRRCSDGGHGGHRAQLLWFLLACSWVAAARAQAQKPAARTDPVEVAALNAILGRWGTKPPETWNTTGDPCSGTAVDDTNIDDNPVVNPGIKCDCSDKNSTVCHIVKLRVYALNVVGQIPAELENLTHLANLNLMQNYLTGPVPSFIGKFPMQYLSLAINPLSGPLPKELGNLTNLISLGISLNNFTGKLPEELGNLTKLEQLYIDSSGFSGPFPLTFSKLKNLKIMWISDNDFTGKIPDFIGSLTNLEDLRLQGNSFQGPIPASFSKLTKLTSLRIGDIVNGSSSLSFISNLTSLNVLILRNCKIFDNLEAVNFTKLAGLTLLDLSFNNITGEVPQSILNLNNLGYFGYLAPEYAMRGHLTEKADVFAFGVVALETVAGRSNTDNSLENEKIYLFEWAWGLYEREQAIGIVDPKLDEFDSEEAFRVISVALLCTQGSPHQRPPMSRVMAILTGDIEITEVVTKPSYITEWQLRGGNSSYVSSTNYSGSTAGGELREQREIDPLTLSPAITGVAYNGR
ncbi:hypothetical protein E2562_019965 [Oryza meyeriana var. granulata]|uniref:Disease resistance R13L4/SHOC-2-like LRR domain-containing protein n=1 Tax=Oryza meyeriana var. granulata TaxID=110450 RepID=A0A6G1CG51_9ORYZ|nr:hypothetical protein E2562_019965 [Oryza meyeriana var. granulata]